MPLAVTSTEQACWLLHGAISRPTDASLRRRAGKLHQSISDPLRTIRVTLNTEESTFMSFKLLRTRLKLFNQLTCICFIKFKNELETHILASTDALRTVPS